MRALLGPSAQLALLKDLEQDQAHPWGERAGSGRERGSFDLFDFKASGVTETEESG